MITYRALGKMGRLGNQMWQIASTIGLAHASGQQACFPPWPYRQYFQLPEHMFTGPRGAESHELARFIPEQNRPYLQDLRCFRNIENVIREYFTPSNEALNILDPLLMLHNPEDAASVHVRRGDYAETWRGHGMLERDFYLDHWPEGRVLVFSDDPEWCSVNLPGEIVHYEDWQDLLLMASCREHLISNSSFSWWAAWLGSPTVFYPTPWFTGIETGDIIEPWWVPVPR